MKQYDEFRQYKKCRVCQKNKLVTELIGTRCKECQPTQKECKTCKITKPLTDFTKRSYNTDGRAYDCRICFNRAVAAKKKQERTTIRIKNTQRKGTIEWDVYQFFGQHQVKLSKKELDLICCQLKQSEFKLTTLDEILKRYKVGIDEYIMEYENPGKAVLQFELEDKECLNPIARYISLAEASIAIKGDKTGMGSISAVCRGVGYTGLGYRWRFESE